MPYYCQALKPGGELIMSGFYVGDLEPIKKRAIALGLHFSRSTENDQWVAGAFTLK